MNAVRSRDRYPLISRRKTRLLAIQVLISNLQAGIIRKCDLVDEDASFAELNGARRHHSFIKHAEALEDDSDTSGAQPLAQYRVDTQVNRLAISYLEACRARLSTKAISVDDHVERNIRRLAQLLDLNEIETRLVDFAVRMEANDQVFKACEAFSGHGRHGEITFHRLLARILGCSRRDIQQALSPESQLSVTGLLGDSDGVRLRDLTGASHADFGDLTLMRGVTQTVMAPGFDFDKIFSPFVRLLPTPGLALHDFDFMAGTVEVMRALLEGALHSRARGVQILLYGVPGTGKSELSNALAHAVGAHAYAVASESVQGTPYDRDDRFRCLRIARYALKARSDSVLIFDEVEDVFPGRFGATHDNRRQKGWLNGMLESSPVPGIWITNSLAEIDPAYLRRFNMVVEMKRPPRATRRRMAERYLGYFDLDPALVQRVADKPSVTAADLSRTGRTLGLVGDTLDGGIAAATILSAGTARVQVSELQPPGVFRVADFDPALINTDLDIARLTSQLVRSGEGRLCFYGPPGTGKTALAQHLANTVDRELITISASSWMSPFVGETEHRIRMSFDEAHAAHAVLFIDEADTFLRDRALASRSWESSRVNELLKCLEQARGIVMFATNSFDALDPAVLRRLDIKAAFRPLQSDQAAALFEATLAANEITIRETDRADIEQIRALCGIVGGDFAAACRGIQVSGAPLTAQSLAEAVSEEVRLRDHQQSVGIGFI